MRRWAAWLLAAALPVQAALLDWSADERARIAALGPWPPAPVRDTSNRTDGRADAVRLGRRLFFDASISASGSLSCAGCHRPARAFSDGVPAARRGRNTPGLLDVAQQRWFGWDGAHDSLWAANLAPLVAADEIGATPAHLRERLTGDADYRRLFGAPRDDGSVAVNAAKAMAAYLATLTSPRTPFDDFRDALVRGDTRAAARYPADAQRGLRLFIGEGRCTLCHAGAGFRNGEFGDIGIPFFRDGSVDGGRWQGIARVQGDPMNRLGPFSDDRSPARAPVSRLVREPRHFGEFKVPGLRQLVHTAPYMHDGSLATIEDVVRHYSELDLERIHADGARVLRPLKLDAQGAADLAAFLRSLSAPAAALRRAGFPRRRGSFRSPTRRGRRRGSVRCRTAASGCARRTPPAGGRWGRGPGARRSRR